MRHSLTLDVTGPPERSRPGVLLVPQVEVHHQSRGDSRDDLVPTPRPLLSENSHRRIPRRVFALEHPEPFGFEAIQVPHGLPQRARQMHHGGIDTDDQIQLINERRGFKKIPAFVHPVENSQACFRDLARLRTLLKVDEVDPRDAEQQGKLLQTTSSTPGILWITRTSVSSQQTTTFSNPRSFSIGR